MIILWLYKFFMFLVRLIVPPPEELFIEINAKCPVCGHRDGKISSVLKNGKIAVQHHCNIDGSIWFEDAIVTDAHKVVYPKEVLPSQFQ